MFSGAKLEEYLNGIKPIPILKNWFNLILQIVFNGSIYTAHYVTLPYIFCFAFWNYAINQTWQITIGILQELKGLFKIIPLSINIFYWSTILPIQSLFWSESDEEVTSEVKNKIYKPIKTILGILKFDFPDSKHAAALYGFFTNLRIFGSRLPFPSFLFEKVFRRVNFGENTVTMIINAPRPEPKILTDTTISTKTSEPGPSQESEEKPNVSAESSTSPKSQRVDEKSESVTNESDIQTTL